MLAVAAVAYGWTGGGLVDAMLAIVRDFAQGNPESGWGAGQLAQMERNAGLFRVRLGG
jgi:hypothetical protein